MIHVFLYFSFWVDRVFLWNNLMKIHTEIVYNVHLYLYWQDIIIYLLPFTINSILLNCFSVCKVCTLEEEFITCTIFLLWSWQEIEEFDNTKGVIIIRKSKKCRQHNDQKKNKQKDKPRSTKHTYKTKDRVTRTPLKTGSELRCPGMVGSSCSTSGTRHVSLVKNPVIKSWMRKRPGLRQVEHIRGQLWHRYPIAVKQVMENFRSDDFNITKRNPWFSSFLVSSNPLSRKSW
jgi:hypothetical protein